VTGNAFCQPGLPHRFPQAPDTPEPVVDLFDGFSVVGAGMAAEVWPVDAQGRSR
jgi:hypothetical protein